MKALPLHRPDCRATGASQRGWLPDDGDLWPATAKIGQQVANAAGSDGYDNAINPNNGATCDVAGPLDAATTLRDGECVVSVLGTPQDGMRTVQSRSCSDFCAMGGSFDGQYVALSAIALRADPVGSDGKMVYRPK